MARYLYRPHILQALAGHGVTPRPDTPPEQLRAFVNDLYTYELRRLRAALLAGRIPTRQYAAHVRAVRARYWLLSVPLADWVEPGP